MSKRLEFSAKVKRAALDRAGGRCECGCDRRFTNHPKERPHFDHDLPAYLGGTGELDNCKVLRVECHLVKTAQEDTPRIVKSRRVLKKQSNLSGVGRKILGSKGTGMRQRMDGTVLFVGRGQ